MTGLQSVTSALAVRRRTVRAWGWPTWTARKACAENNIAQAAVCDLYKKRNEIAKEKIGASDVTTHDDYRKLLERKILTRWYRDA